MHYYILRIFTSQNDVTWHYFEYVTLKITYIIASKYHMILSPA